MSMKNYLHVDSSGYATSSVWSTNEPIPNPGGSVVLWDEPLEKAPTNGARFHVVTREWHQPGAEQAAAMAEAEARSMRNALLASSDWTQGKDALSRITKPQQAAWAVYRQALCDITKQPGFPLDIQWPTRPG